MPAPSLVRVALLPLTPPAIVMDVPVATVIVLEAEAPSATVLLKVSVPVLAPSPRVMLPATVTAFVSV